MSLRSALAHSRVTRGRQGTMKWTMTFEPERWVGTDFPCFLFVPLRFPRVTYFKEDFAVVKVIQNPSVENPQVPGLTCWSHKHICLAFVSPCTTRHTYVFFAK